MHSWQDFGFLGMLSDQRWPCFLIVYPMAIGIYWIHYLYVLKMKLICNSKEKSQALECPKRCSKQIDHLIFLQILLRNSPLSMIWMIYKNKHAQTKTNEFKIYLLFFSVLWIHLHMCELFVIDTLSWCDLCFGKSILV